MALCSWPEHFANLIVDVFFADDTLRELMKLPKDITIIQFIEKYFIRAGYTSTTLKDEPVRIVWGVVNSWETKSNGVQRQEISFDIFVNDKYAHNFSDNRLLFRSDAISNRIRHLLTHGDRYLESYRFMDVGSKDLTSSVIGYSRRNISFQYFITI